MSDTTYSTTSTFYSEGDPTPPPLPPPVCQTEPIAPPIQSVAMPPHLGNDSPSPMEPFQFRRWTSSRELIRLAIAASLLLVVASGFGLNLPQDVEPAVALSPSIERSDVDARQIDIIPADQLQVLQPIAASEPLVIESANVDVTELVQNVSVSMPSLDLMKTAPADVTPTTPVRPAAPSIPIALSGTAPAKVGSIAAPPALCTIDLPSNKDRKFGTVLEWAKTIEEAGFIADQQDKLVFVIHVSGNFEMPEFT